VSRCRICPSYAINPSHHGRDEADQDLCDVCYWRTRAPQWLPIESAPRDGTAILLTNGKDVAEGHWYFEEGGTTEYRDLDGRYIGQEESDGYDGWLDWDGGMQPDPTHWQPLPAPPEV